MTYDTERNGWHMGQVSGTAAIAWFREAILLFAVQCFMGTDWHFAWFGYNQGRLNMISQVTERAHSKLLVYEAIALAHVNFTRQ
jgi:hypothetical protein